MPELPEVEYLANELKRQYAGAKFSGLVFLRHELRDPIPVDLVSHVLKGQTVDDVFRRAKYLLIKTKVGYGIFHLGMTGQILTNCSSEPACAHTHVIFEFEHHDQTPRFLHYVDVRRFGRISALAGHSLVTHPWFARLGVEPLEERQLGVHLFRRLRSRQLAIKNALMDPRVLVGVGNIYASESLFRANLLPSRLTSEISLSDYRLLGRSIQSVLKLALEHGGTTFRDYRHSTGNSGEFATLLRVYGRQNKLCQKCRQTTIEKSVISGRSTFHCARCQK